MALLRGGSANLLPGRVYGMTVPYSQSLTPPEPAYVAVSSAGIRMQDERKGRITFKIYIKAYKPNKPNKSGKRCRVEQARFQRECGVSDMPQGNVMLSP